MTGSEFKAARKALGLTMADLAKVLRVHDHSTVSKWEREVCTIPGPVITCIELLQERDHDTISD